MIQFSPDDQDQDPLLASYLSGRKPLSKNIAGIARGAATAPSDLGFSPDDPDDNWLSPPLDRAAFRVSGASAAPQASVKPSAGSGNVLLGRGPASMPPPERDTPPAPAPPVQMAPPPQIDHAAPTDIPPEMRQEAPVVPQAPVAAKPIDQTQDQIGKVEQDLADKRANAPQLKSNWAQRLGMAVLAAGKLAPYAQQIIHPKYTEQMGAYQAGVAGDEAHLKSLGLAENALTLAGQREAVEEQRKAQAKDYAAKEEESARAHQAREQLKGDEEFTKSLGKDDVITGMDPNDPTIPQLQQQGYHIIDDLRDHREGVAKMKVAIPPRFVQVTADNQDILPHRKPGELVPWSEYKASLAEHQKQQNALALEQAKQPHEPMNPTHLSARSVGAKTGNAQVDAMTPEEAQRALERNKERPATINVNSNPENMASNAELIANYQQAPLSGFAMSKPEGQAIMAQVHKLNPDYHSEYYNNFNKTETDATTGKIGSSANALNTMIGHLSVLDQASDALKNNDFQMLNRLANAIGVQTGNSAVTTYRTIVHRIGPEVEKAYIGAGGTGTERGANEQDFDPNMAPQQIKDNVRISASLADSKIKALQSQYQRGTYGRGQQKLISDESEATRQRLSGAGGGGTAVSLKSGKTATFPNAQAASDFKKQHPELVK